MKIIMWALLVSSILHSASFDCKKASTKIEKAICTNSELSYLDETLSASYKYSSTLFTQEEEKSSFIRDQRKWLKSRNKCTGTNTLNTCLQKSYKARINKLKSYQENYKSKPTKYEFRDVNNKAFLVIKPLADNTYLVSGESYYDITNKYGPNIGTVNFISELKSNILTFEDRGYILTIEISKGKLTTTENRPGHFGMNVSFSGEYISEEENVNEYLSRLFPSLNGNWISNKYYESSNCGKTGSFNTESLSINIEYPNITIQDLETGKDYFYKAIKYINSKHDTVYKKSDAYNDSQHWGSCGGSVKIPYYESYSFFVLKDMSTDKIIRMVYSKNEKGNSTLVVDLWSDLEFSLENIFDPQGTDLSFIEDGYTLQKIKSI